MTLEEALAGDLSELDYLGRKLGLGGLDPNTTPGGVEIYKDCIRYVAKQSNMRVLKTMMEDACDQLGRT